MTHSKDFLEGYALGRRVTEIERDLLSLDHYSGDGMGSASEEELEVVPSIVGRSFSLDAMGHDVRKVKKIIDGVVHWERQDDEVSLGQHSHGTCTVGSFERRIKYEVV